MIMREQSMFNRFWTSYVWRAVFALEIGAGQFTMRGRLRIDFGCLSVLIQDRRIVFKADVKSESPGVFCPEGVFVCPDKHVPGYGSRLLSSVCESAIAKRNIGQPVDESRNAIKRVLEKVGFVSGDKYETNLLVRSVAGNRGDYKMF